ncbi:MAG: type II toxin-antitoxin system Phd/YefM family antitoxin [Gammaproteobacteria bacterium]|nr:type II toxin-antitoxin system Phd/YefM family antitoxin [Gammaproteobacteria bacterium]
MEELTANQAKTQFDVMLSKVQGAPIQINKNGKPVAVVVSNEDYESIEKLKLELLKSRARKAMDDIQSGYFSEGKRFINELCSGK